VADEAQAGDLFPSAAVTGIDLSPIQPVWVPSNVKFFVDDAEDEWMNGPDFDLIHFRTMSAVLKTLPEVIKMTYPYVLDSSKHAMRLTFWC
jgi:hypothetical protein